ncbi:MAG: hypothetical protein H8E48_05035 [Chloroflexi bacterium]|nr:hypothetical protein [Chloroflexota bacterium]
MTTTQDLAIPLKPEWQDATVEARPRSYVINGTSYQRVTTALGIINKPALVPWATKTATEAVRSLLLDKVKSGDVRRTGRFMGRDQGKYDDYANAVDAMIVEAKKKPDSIKEDAADLGHLTHEFVDRINRCENPDGILEILQEVPENVLPAVKGATEYLEDYKIQVISTEQIVWHPSLLFAGTFDGMGWMGDKLVLFDWKRSGGIYWEYALQLGAYARCFQEITGVMPDQAHVVRLSQGTANADGRFYELKTITDLEAAWYAYHQALMLHKSQKLIWFKEDVPAEPEAVDEEPEPEGITDSR